MLFPRRSPSLAAGRDSIRTEWELSRLVSEALILRETIACRTTATRPGPKTDAGFEDPSPRPLLGDVQNGGRKRSPAREIGTADGATVAGERITGLAQVGMVWAKAVGQHLLAAA